MPITATKLPYEINLTDCYRGDDYLYGSVNITDLTRDWASLGITHVKMQWRTKAGGDVVLDQDITPSVTIPSTYVLSIPIQVPYADTELMPGRVYEYDIEVLLASGSNPKLTVLKGTVKVIDDITRS